MAKKKAVARKKKVVSKKSTTVGEQNPAAADVTAFARALAERARKRGK